MPNVKTMCSIVEPWPDSMTPWMSFCCLAGVDLARDRATEDLLRVQLRVARPAGGVDERDVELLDDLAIGEEERRLHPELAPAWVLRDGRLLAGRAVRVPGGGRLGGHAAQV